MKFRQLSDIVCSAGDLLETTCLRRRMRMTTSKCDDADSQNMSSQCRCRPESDFCIFRFTATKAFKLMLNEINDLAGQHEVPTFDNSKPKLWMVMMAIVMMTSKKL